MKNIVIRFVFGVMLLSIQMEGLCQSAIEIEGAYDKMVSDNFRLAKQYVPLDLPEGREPMKNLYYLRPRGLNKFYVEYLTYTGGASATTNAERRKIVDFQSDEGACLSYLALLGSGTDVEEVFNALVEKKQKVVLLATFFWNFGRICSGRFFDRYVEKRASDNSFLEEKSYFERYISVCKVFSSAFSENRELHKNYVGNIEMPQAFKTEQALHFEKIESTLVDLFANSKQKCEEAKLSQIIHAMGHIRSLKAVPLLTENLTVCPQVSTNAPSGYVFPAAEALIEIGPAIGYCFGQLEKAAPLSVEESLWLRISHELYPEGLEYDLMRRAETNDVRAARLLDALPWRRLDSDFNIIEKP